MGNMIVLLIILLCTGFAYLKTNLVKTVALIFFSIFAAIIAFGYFEILSGYLIKQSTENIPAILPWLPAISFLLIFALALAIFYTTLTQILKVNVKLAEKPELIGKIVGGIILGFILSGVFLVFLFLAPLPANLPYQKFNPHNPDIDSPASAIFNPEGFITGVFSNASSGSLSGNKSFSVLHPNFIDQVYLNRLSISSNISITSDDEIILPAENAAWIINEKLTDENGTAVSSRNSNVLITLRTGFKNPGIKKTFSFSVSQMRLLCKKAPGTKTFKGRSESFYPIGYITITGRIKRTKLNEQIALTRSEMTERLPIGTGKWIDFVYEIPDGFTPFALEFKLNDIKSVPGMAGPEDIPEADFFIPSKALTSVFAELEGASAKIYGVSLTASGRLLQDVALNNINTNELLTLFTADSNSAPDFEDNQFNYTKSRLTINSQSISDYSPDIEGAGLKPVAQLLMPLNEYKIIDLKCNTPAVGSPISPQDLPTLIDAYGKAHCAVGIIASGKIGDRTIYQFDYCAVTSANRADGLIIGENQNVTATCITNIWLPRVEGLESVSEFHLLYLVKGETLITNVQPANTTAKQMFSQYQAFLAK